MVTSTDDRQGEYKAICGRWNGKIQVAFERFRNAFATDNLSVCCCVKVYFLWRQLSSIFSLCVYECCN